MSSITKKFIEDFLAFCGHDLKKLQGIDATIDNFLEKLKRNVFEIPLKIGKIEYKQRVLMAFCKFRFHNNFTSYQLDYFPKIYPYICKEKKKKKDKSITK